MQKNIFNTNNDFIVYDIYNTTGNLTEYFFVCQKTGKEKTINNFLILDIFKGHFLTMLDEQLKRDKNSRISSEDLNDLLWSYTCDTLNINYSFKDIFENNVFSINTDLSEVTEEDILELNFIAYGPSYIKDKDCTLKENDSFIIYRSSADKRFELIKRKDFSALTHNKALELKEKYNSEGVSKKMVELSNEAFKSICKNSDIQYIENKEDECNHDYKFIKRVKSDDLFSDEGVFYYSFQCSHCGETKYVLNCDIIDYIHETSIEFIKCELSAPKEARAFNLQVFDFALDKFLSNEKIHEAFKLILKEDYELPTLNKELILVTDDDLTSSNIVLTNTIVENVGLFSKKIVPNTRFIISKNGTEIIFTKEAI